MGILANGNLTMTLVYLMMHKQNPFNVLDLYGLNILTFSDLYVGIDV